MKNFMERIKRFLKNKNTVTIICVVLAIAILYVGYNWRIKQQTNPIKVPYAKVEIQPRTLITEDMVGIVEIPRSMLKNNTVRSISLVIGKYSNYNTVIPNGSVFYLSTLIDLKDMPDSAFGDIPDGYTVVSLPVDNNSTYGNSIFPGNYIDLYFKNVDETGKILLGKLIESIEVLDVKDSQGKHVFENTIEGRTPSSLLFAVPERMHLLLRKAMYIGGTTIIPVPRNKSYSLNPGETLISSTYIQDFILAKTVFIPDEKLPVINDTKKETEEKNAGEKNE